MTDEYFTDYRQRIEHKWQLTSLTEVFEPEETTGMCNIQIVFTRK